MGPPDWTAGMGEPGRRWRVTIGYKAYTVNEFRDEHDAELPHHWGTLTWADEAGLFDNL
jgi:hypothetical protein